MGLLIFLLGALYLLLIYGMRYLRQGEVYQTVQQQALIAMRKVTVELANSNMATVSFGTAPTPHVIFLSLEKELTQPDRWVYSYNAGGLPLWQKWVCFFLDGASGHVVRTEIPLASPVTLPPTPAAPSLASFESVVPPHRQVVARHIDTLEVGSGAVAQTLFVSVTARDDVASDKDTVLTLSSQIRVEN